MATLAYAQAQPEGKTLTFAAASAGGDAVKPNDRGMVLVNNGSGASITVTVVTPGLTKYGQQEPDVPVTVAAGAIEAIGPFPSDLADKVTGLVSLTYSAVTTVTVCAVAV